MTVGELAIMWKESYAKLRLQVTSQVRYETYFRLHILPVFGNLKLGDLRQHAVEAWLLRLRERGLSPKTCNDCLSLLRKVLNDGVRWGHLVANPIAAVAKLKRPEAEFSFLTKAQLKQFLVYVWRQCPEAYPLYFIAANTGMRLGEILGLKWDAVDLENRRITIKRTYCISEKRIKETTKAARIRRVPINGQLLELLMAKRRTLANTVISNCDGTHAARITRQMSEAAGLPSIHFHGLRHSFASMWMMEGKPIFELQKILGHSTIAMTERYSHLAPEHLAGKTDFIDLDVRRFQP